MKLHTLLRVLSTVGSSVCSYGDPSTAETVDFQYPLGNPQAATADIITWDEHSLFIHGERVMIMSGEFHPWRLPVPSLWLDVFQKIKAIGFNCVSFYVNWALVEGAPGNFSAEGVFALEPFFSAASQAGIYLIARPGPYINAEVSFGGFPGWMQRVKGRLRTSDADYLAATNNYAAHINAIIAKAQITNGGPVILYQPENEYTWGIPPRFPDGEYMQYVEDQARRAGIVVPLISNDAGPLGHNAPGSGKGAVDIYGHDAYPLGFNCSNPEGWTKGALAGIYHRLHKLQSPSTPFSLLEFQGGAFDPWGGAGFEKCASLVNQEFERLFYKNNFAAGTSIHNIYMIYGGTNWGNIGHPGGYTSYDYGSAIKEDRTVAREKYSELKLQAEWVKASPGFLAAEPGAALVLTYSDNIAITVTRLNGNDTASRGSFYVVRHSDYTTTTSSNYKLRLPTSRGDLSIPTLFESLILNGRDSKIVVTDYDIPGYTVLYSTAEVLTHFRNENASLLVVYTGHNEMNELALATSTSLEIMVDDRLTISHNNNVTTIAWPTSPERIIFKTHDLTIHILDRYTAYNYWVIKTNTLVPLIINGPYLIREASLHYRTLDIKADFNKTTMVEIIGSPNNIDAIYLNGKKTDFERDSDFLLFNVIYDPPDIKLPSLNDLDWSSLDSLPEINKAFDDSHWPLADHPTSNNSYQRLWTPTSLFSSDYGFHSGVILYRGHFTAKGTEQTFKIQTQGGTAYGHSIWLNETFIGSWIGAADSSNRQEEYRIPKLDAGKNYVFTVVVDHMGLDESFVAGLDLGKAPRGILRYSLRSSWFSTTAITWKMTGNLGGEVYQDRARGPLNEGGLYAERQGFHLPKSVTGGFSKDLPLDEIYTPGVSFFTAPLTLDLPSDQYDIPLSFKFGGVTGGAARVQLYVNGWQFGKYVSNIGPQTSFPVPEGILNYNGENWVSLMVWNLEETVTKVMSFGLEAGVPVLTGRSPVTLVDSPVWTARDGAY
ncbi:glycoside hydrolase superfamily [Xylariales sp. PMI_506]|nr:glycoside hydrolase superfamily [Xylariales sp. PMI_506]